MESTTTIETPELTLSIGGANTFLLPADGKYVLIDTGFEKHAAAFEKRLLDEGILPDRLRCVILTHGHYDHLGNAWWLKERYGVPVAIHEGDVWRTKTEVAGSVKGHGVLGFFLARTINKEMAQTKLHPFEPDILFSDGYRFDDFAFAAEAVHVPGHTAGSCVIITDSGTLYGGDMFLNEGPFPSFAVLIEDMKAFKASRAKLKSMKSRISVIQPGHGESFPATRVL